nr:14676_t:CDS:2 [Entrophospora candida]
MLKCVLWHQIRTSSKQIQIINIDDDDNDDEFPELPSVEELLNKATTQKNENEKNDESLDYDALKDETLDIPGELVLAYPLKKYYPAKVNNYEKPGKYHVIFWDESKAILSRNQFYTIWEKGFVTCKLGEIVMDKEDPDYEDAELTTAILDLEPALSKVLLGDDKLAWRYDHFVEGKKKRQLLASHVSEGPFNQSEFGLIAKVLRHLYVPDVANAIDKKDNIVKPSELIKSIMKLKNKQHQEEEEQDNQQEISLLSSSQQFSNSISTPHKHNNLTNAASHKNLYPQSESPLSQQFTIPVSTSCKRKLDATPPKHSHKQSSQSPAQKISTAAVATSPSLPSLSSSSLNYKLKLPFFNYSSDLQL